MKSNQPAAETPRNPSKFRWSMAGKIAVGVFAVWYVLHAKMIDFGSLATMLREPKNAVVAFFFLTLSALLCAFRWYRLAQRQGLKMSLRSAVELTLIGNFFNTFLPGSVGGDVIKAWYAAGREGPRKGRAVFTVLFDRMVGLSVFVLYSAIALLPLRSSLKVSPQFAALQVALFALSGVLAFGALALLLPWPGRERFFDRVEREAQRVPLLAKLIGAVSLYRHAPGTMLLAASLTALSLFGTSLQYFWQGASLGINFPLANYFFFVPIALTVSAVPLLPGGLGVGQVAFFTLFSWMGSSTPEQGATLCTAVQLYTILFNCIGAIPYVRFRRAPKDLPQSATVTRTAAGR